MKTYLDCIPCFFRQALEAGRLAGADEPAQKRILDRLSRLIPDFPLTSSPPEMGRFIYSIVRRITGNKDPYKDVKEKYNKIALNLYPDLKKKVSSSGDPLLTAIRLAVAGNIIDYGVSNTFSIEHEIEVNLKKDFAIFDYPALRDALDRGVEEILYLGDNAGEIVFDMLLIEELINRGIKITCAVKEKPVINDALLADAAACGLDRIARVISCGGDAPGTVLSTCSGKFLRIFREAKLIISKGQGNYEALAEEKRPIFFLFKAKCTVIARDIGCKPGDIILKKQEGVPL